VQRDKKIEGNNTPKATFARGMIARKLKPKRRATSKCIWCAMTLRGTKTRRILNQDPKKNHLYDSSQVGSPSALRIDMKRC